MRVLACQKVSSCKTSAKAVYAQVGDSDSRTACLKRKECTNACGNGGKFVKSLAVLGQCYGAEVHYLNSSKHRKLIGQR